MDLLSALKNLDEKLPAPYGLEVVLADSPVPLKDLEIHDLGEFVSLGTKSVTNGEAFIAVVMAKSRVSLTVTAQKMNERETPE